jgi:hypothetical protein
MDEKPTWTHPWHTIRNVFHGLPEFALGPPPRGRPKANYNELCFKEPIFHLDENQGPSQLHGRNTWLASEVTMISTPLIVDQPCPRRYVAFFGFSKTFVFHGDHMSILEQHNIIQIHNCVMWGLTTLCGTFPIFILK